MNFQDRILHHCLCDYILKPCFERWLIYDNASCRKGKGVHFAMQRLTKIMREYFKIYRTDGYILKYDIRKCFQIIDQYEYTSKKGIPMGNQTNQWFAHDKEYLKKVY